MSKHDNSMIVFNGVTATRPLRFFCAAWLLLVSNSSYGAVNDIFPTDAVALPDGTVNMALYAAHRKQAGPYLRGEKLLNGEIDIDIAAVRLSRHLHLNDSFSLAPIAVLSWSRSETSPQSLSNLIGHQANGLGDLRLGGALWFLRDPKNLRYASVNLLATLPTGSYDKNQALNIGENRWKWVLGGGLLWSLSDHWVVDIAPEIAWYGDNDTYVGQRKLSQDMSAALTGYLRYRVTPKFHLMAGGQVNRGGATAINGVSQHNAPDNTRLSFGLFYLTDDKQQWQLRYSRDIDIDAGFRTAGELTLRYSILY